MKFSAWMLFVPLWLTLSYFPIAHMVWGGGFLGSAANGISGLLFDGDPLPIDYAGGTVVHINAGVAGLVLALMLGKRIGFLKEPMRPHNLTLTMIGAGLLWMGWYGFNVGSIVFGGPAPEADAEQFINETSLVWLNTTVATCAAILGWLAVEKIRHGKGTSLGAASGVVAGLVAITPACGALSPVGSIFLGLVAGAACALAVGLKYRFGYDDALDVVGVHLVGGLVGTIGAGFLSTSTGLFYGARCGPARRPGARGDRRHGLVGSRHVHRGQHRQGRRRPAGRRGGRDRRHRLRRARRVGVRDRPGQCAPHGHGRRRRPDGGTVLRRRS